MAFLWKKLAASLPLLLPLMLLYLPRAATSAVDSEYFKFSEVDNIVSCFPSPAKTAAERRLWEWLKAAGPEDIRTLAAAHFFPLSSLVVVPNRHF